MKEGRDGERLANKKQTFMECLLCTICCTRHFHISSCSRLCQFPMAAAKNYHKLSGLNNRNVFCHSSGGQESVINIAGLKLRCEQGHTLSGGSRREPVSCLFSCCRLPTFLGFNHIPPNSALWSHCLLLFTCHISLNLSLYKDTCDQIQDPLG